MSAAEPKKRIKDDAKDVALLDGRVEAILLTGVTCISSDQARHRYDFGWNDPNLTCCRSATAILHGMFSTHSLSYVQACTRYVGAAIAEGRRAGRPMEMLGLVDIAEWPARHGLTTWPFLRAVLSRWTESGLPGLEPELIAFLTGPEAFEERYEGQYFALVANDPERGALTEQELRSVRDGVNRAFEEGGIDLSEWALVWFLIATGVRPVQIARMRRGDVIVTSGPEGNEITLAIPLAKGEQQVGTARWKRKCPSVLADVLLRYLWGPGDQSHPDACLFFERSDEIQNRIQSIFRRVKTWSDRLGGPVPIFPYRFRYTLGTRAIALGATDHEAARLLTHRSTSCVHYYRAALPTLQKPIADAIGPEMGFIASVFQGRPIDTLEEATRKGQPGAVIRDFAHLVGQKLGACGTMAKCHQDAPRACLTCHKFEPLRGAPWEQFLQVLEEDLESETEDRIRLITEEQIDAVRAIIIERDAHARAVQ
ncbi:MAG: site-specific integrase [Mesorhizobium sp.]|uniref:hypothetical protein n=1 Tax=Mesorhizobium sp. TaxID=1871066 RepID=UPI00120BEDF6|nr:hypothetical protein [Mesorhizobium sp.]TIV77832.1 MAG: site-specific integrase [Mesorhizobium sp.]